VPMCAMKIARATPALSDRPMRFRAAKMHNSTMVAQNTSSEGQICWRYCMADAALTTAVAMYESRVRHAAMAATGLLVVLSSSVYVPPFSGSAL
jgi:hypothetical protein